MMNVRLLLTEIHYPLFVAVKSRIKFLIATVVVLNDRTLGQLQSCGFFVESNADRDFPDRLSPLIVGYALAYHDVMRGITNILT